MDMKDQQIHWNKLGLEDPMWAVCTNGPKGKLWDKKEFFDSGIQLLNDVMNYCNELEIDFPRNHALDFGCGLGRLSQALCMHFDNVSGIDIAPSMVEQARNFNQYVERCNYSCVEDYEISQFPDGYFDFILTYSTLQHIEPKYVKRYIQSFLRLLGPKGIIVFQEHAEPLQILSRFKNTLKCHTPDTLMQIYKQFRYRNCSEPIIELYGIPKTEMVAFLKNNSAEIIDIIAAPHASGTWKTYQYIVCKQK